MGGRKKMSKIKESKGFRVFGRLVGRQESIAMLYVVIMMVPNVLLTITERYPFTCYGASFRYGGGVIGERIPIGRGGISAVDAGGYRHGSIRVPENKRLYLRRLRR